MLESGAPTTYQLHVSLIDILQIAMGWSDDHLNRFTIYGVCHPDGIWFSDYSSDARLADLQLREREKFLYEYDFNDRWCHQIQVEAIAPTNCCSRSPIDYLSGAAGSQG